MQDKIAELKIIRKRVDELIPHELNPRFHPNSQVDKIVEWLSKVGYYKSIVVQKDTNKILAGHGVLQGLIADGYTHVDVSEVDQPDKWAMALLAWDNKSGELSSWEQVNLIALQAELGEMDVQMEEMGFDAGEIDSMGSNAVTEEDEPPPVSEEDPITQTGDLWILGSHRLVCGDAMKRPDVAALAGGCKASLLFLDPPYDFGYTEDIDKIIEPLLGDTHILLMHSDKEMIKYIRSTKHTFRTFYVWNHNKHKLRWGGPLQDHTLMGSFVAGKPGAYQITQDAFGTVINVEYLGTLPEEEKVISHSKSVKAVGKFIEHYSHAEELVFDLFGGGGTTIIAAEQLSRKCFMMEIDPLLCDTIVARWEKFTDEEARVERAGVELTYSTLVAEAVD